MPHSSVRLPPATTGLLIRYCCTALKSDVFGLVGGKSTSSETFAEAAGDTETTAVADFVESATLVAVITTEVCAVTVGAVNNPLEETVPWEAVHVAAVFELLETVAANWAVAPEFTLVLVGVTLMLTLLLLAMVRLTHPRPRSLWASVTHTANVKVPAACGVPEIPPVCSLSTRPAGIFCS